MTPMARFLTGKMSEFGLPSIRALARLTGVSHATLNRLFAGKGVADEVTLRKLSVALETPVTELRELAGVPAGESEQFVAPPEFNQLSRDERELLVALGRQFLASRGQQTSEDGTGTAATWSASVTPLRPSTPPARERTQRAARQRPKTSDSD